MSDDQRRFVASFAGVVFVAVGGAAMANAFHMSNADAWKVCFAVLFLGVGATMWFEGMRR